jgi:hypothetical protein
MWAANIHLRIVAANRVPKQAAARAPWQSYGSCFFLRRAAKNMKTIHSPGDDHL